MTIMDLNTKVQFIKGVGPRFAMLLEKLNITTIRDLITHYPIRYEDRNNFMPISNIIPGNYVTLRGRFQTVENKPTRRPNFILTNAIFADQTGSIMITWFNQKYKQKEIEKIIGKPVILYGLAEYSNYNIQIKTPKYELESEDQINVGGIVPIYPCTDGIDGDWLRKLIHKVVPEYGHLIEEDLPEDIRLKYSLTDKKTAIQNIHFPKDENAVKEARHRLVFDELFAIQLGLAERRRIYSTPGKGIAFGVPPNYKKELKEIIPFELTEAQKRCIREIINDMTKNMSMNRLLQGDVGSGKTVVALAAMLFCIRNGYQAALMAPTEILAQQHYISLSNMISNLGVLDVNVVLLKSNMKAAGRREALSAIENGMANIVVGTHALISEDVVYNKLGLVIIDEQHKFGVLQRGKLKDKGENPDVLVMTATPIPRTLTLMVYGDLSVSVIDEMPKGRKPVITHYKTKEEREKVYTGLKKLLDRGEKAYVVCPLVEESENLQVKAATELFEDLKEGFLLGYKVGLIHGKMKGEDKDAIMKAFRLGEIQVLVSTIVIEVGVDVPQANTIIIEDAERFGLSQLHQLRGRVGRDGGQGFCILVSDPVTEDSKQRMEIMTKTNNGFEIAEEDLILRGPGEFTGTRQSGLDGLKIANIFKDQDILEETKEAATELVAKNPTLSGEECAVLRAELLKNLDKFNLVSIS